MTTHLAMLKKMRKKVLDLSLYPDPHQMLMLMSMLGYKPTSQQPSNRLHAALEIQSSCLEAPKMKQWMPGTPSQSTNTATVTVLSIMGVWKLKVNNCWNVILPNCLLFQEPDLKYRRHKVYHNLMAQQNSV